MKYITIYIEVTSHAPSLTDTSVLLYSIFCHFYYISNNTFWKLNFLQKLISKIKCSIIVLILKHQANFALSSWGKYPAPTVAPILPQKDTIFNTILWQIIPHSFFSLPRRRKPLISLRNQGVCILKYSIQKMISCGNFSCHPSA